MFVQHVKVEMLVEEKKFGDYTLVVSRDPGLPSYTYFWTHNNKLMSPFFNREVDAIEWLKKSEDEK